MVTDHRDEISIVTKTPLTLMLTLPDGTRIGRWAAAEAFAASIDEIRRQYPEQSFQFLPFSYTDGDGFQGLDAVMAIGSKNQE